MFNITGKMLQNNKQLKKNFDILKKQNKQQYIQKSNKKFYMSQDLVKENKMLKDYVAALQGQNKSRNIEKDVLLRQIDILTNENNDLRNQMSKQNQVSARSNQVEALTKNNKDLQDKLKKLTNELNNVTRFKSEAESERSLLKAQLQNLNKRLQQAQQSTQTNQSSSNQLAKLRGQNQQLKKQNYLLSEKQNEILRLQTINKQLRQKINQGETKKNLIIKENENKFQQNKNIEFQRVREQIIRQSQLKKQNQINLLKNHYENILAERDQKISDTQRKLVQAERKVYTNQNNSTAEVVQLRNVKKDLESKIGMFERERAGVEQVMNQLRAQISQKNNILSRIQAQKSQLQNSRFMIIKKDEQIEKSQIIIQTLKDNIKKLERQSQQLQRNLMQSNIKIAQSNTMVDQRRQQQFQNVENKYLLEMQELNRKIKRQQQDLPHIIGQQRKVLQERQRQNQELKKIIAGLSENNNSLLQKLKSLQDYQIGEYQRNKETTKNDQEDLRNVVEDLKKQLKSVKSDFRRIQEENKKLQQLFGSRISQNLSAHQRIGTTYDPVNINRSFQQREKKTSHYVTEVSPKHFYSPMNAQRQQNEVRYSKMDPHKFEKHHQISSKIHSSAKPMNRDKWQALQRRITQLREQNAELKQSLYS